MRFLMLFIYNLKNKGSKREFSNDAKEPFIEFLKEPLFLSSFYILKM